MAREEQLVPPDDWRRRWPPSSYWVRTTLAIVLTVALLAAAKQVKDVLVLVVVSAVVALGLDPAVRRLQRWHFKRGWAVVTIFAATILFVILFLALVAPAVAYGVQQLAASIPKYLSQFENQQGWIGEFARKYNVSFKLQELTKNLPGLASSSFSSILGFTKSVGKVIFSVLTVGVLTVYFLLALPRMRQRVVLVFEPHVREQAERIVDESVQKVGGYVSGNIFISIVAGVLSYIAMKLLGVPYAEALAMWVAIADLIPSVGAMLGAIVCVIVAASQGLWIAVGTTAYFLAYQQLVENYFLQPRIMKQAIDLSPALVIVSVLIGGSLAGFAGALLALPIAATIKVVIYDIWLRERMKATLSKPTADDEAVHPT